MERSISQLEEINVEEGLRGHLHDDEFIDDENDLSDREDALEIENNDTSSEQSFSGDEVPDVVGPQISASDGTVWNLHPSTTPQRLNTIIRRGRTADSAIANASTVLTSWESFISEDMIHDVTEFTNKRIAIIRQCYSRPEQANFTSTSEIRALIGLLYIIGVYRTAHTNISDIWKNDGCGIEICRLTMPEYRIRLLLRALRFDDAATREERRAIDKLAAFRDFHQKFVTHCINNYVPGDYLTCDEMLDSFRGRCAFRQYMGNKPAKYGLKIYALSDARSFYTFNFEVYTGRQPNGPYLSSNTPEDVVKRLVEPIRGSGRVIVTDNYYTSFKLGQDLKTEYNLRLLGTVRKNRRFVPPIMLARRPPQTSFFAFNNVGTLVTYAKSKKTFVLLFSTMDVHKEALITPNDDGYRPEMNVLYNKTKSGVDHVDQLKNTYSVSRSSRRWPLTLFFSYLNIAGINGYITFKDATSNDEVTRKDYLKHLGLALVQEHAISRIKVRQTPLQIKRRLMELFRTEEDEDTRPPPPADHEERCYLCESRLNRKTKTRCMNCTEFICKKDHTLPLCTRCVPRVGPP